MFTKMISYESAYTKSPLNVCYHEDSFWMTMESMGRLFGVSDKNVYRVLKEILTEGKLNEFKVNQHIEIEKADGKKYPANFYNLDVIMAVGYRVNTKETIAFRQWSMYMLKHYLLQGVQVNYSVIDALKRKVTQLIGA